LKEESSSFLKKRTKRLLCLHQFHDRGPTTSGMGRDIAAGARIKSLLLLFFRKEDPSFAAS
jgi:hypothetical protein